MHTIRATYIPAAGFPRSDLVLLTGAPAFGVDFVAKAYGAFPWLVLAVLAITYLVLLRAFRSVVLPLKAVLLNLLSVSAAIDVVAERCSVSRRRSRISHFRPRALAWDDLEAPALTT